MQKYAAKATKNISAFMDYLYTRGHKNLFDDKLALRAVKTIFYINKNGIRKMFQEGHLAEHRANIEHEISMAAAQKEIYSCRLSGLRLHHQLTMLQIAGYKNLAKELAYHDNNNSQLMRLHAPET
jgi:hypothetical protein